MYVYIYIYEILQVSSKSMYYEDTYAVRRSSKRTNNIAYVVGLLASS